MFSGHRKYKILLLALSVVISFTAAGQANRYNAATSEQVYVHLDRQIYIAGESIRYKAYLVNSASPETSPCSRILYFSLTGTDPDNTINWRINLNGKPVSGSYLIPEDIEPGMYILKAYTNWMRNGTSEIHFSSRILVLSLIAEEKPDMRLFNTVPKKTKPAVQNQIPELRLNIDGDTFKPGEPVRLQFGFANNGRSSTDAGFSVSVSAVTPFDSLLVATDINESIGPVLSSYSAECVYPIEDRGFIFSGRIIRNAGTPFNRCDVWLAVTDSLSPQVLYSEVDSSGTFRFFLNRSFDNKELILQLADPSRSSDCKLEVFRKTVPIGDTITSRYNLNSEAKEFISTTRNIRLVEAIYRQSKSGVMEERDLRRTSYLNKPDRIIIPAEYAEMRNFREIASNIIPEVRFGNRREVFYLQVLSPNTNSWKNNQLVFLNGVPFTDLAYVSTLGSKDIRKIEIIQSNVLIGKLTLPGLVSIYTYDRVVPENYLRSHTVRFQNTVMPSEETTGQESEFTKSGSHFPDFRNTVYWNPFVSAAAGNTVTLEFPASLLTGKFIIRAQGLTGDGIPVSATADFEVKE